MGAPGKALRFTELMIYLFCTLFAGAVLAAICRPLFRRDDTLESAIIEETEWDLLQRKKEVILGNIQDLDFEYRCGKLSEQDYKKIRAEMSAEAAQVLERIDQIEASQDLDALIRREISNRKKQPKEPRPTTVCSACGHKNPATNKFCAECGAKLRN
jgi:rRNA maturation endonuclease Nob1